ncbi:hypothetical protein CkaCkLH20_09092 [Colletotrichum karsti]|uniref:Uncharacterized protein n=1 Tax=Colletotrichum karsti TaxID=1095194 RepID=A0A9P6HZG5_9PEZI|nr:uncharacterized protein CkaCkLH20_09092 [Colletotrichum karsti]KAF9873279.1 hypothetical protein CkaCkLH20_09092 [Colletotrichum karsti]
MVDVLQTVDRALRAVPGFEYTPSFTIGNDTPIWAMLHLNPAGHFDDSVSSIATRMALMFRAAVDARLSHPLLDIDGFDFWRVVAAHLSYDRSFPDHEPVDRLMNMLKKVMVKMRNARRSHLNNADTPATTNIDAVNVQNVQTDAQTMNVIYQSNAVQNLWKAVDEWSWLCHVVALKKGKATRRKSQIDTKVDASKNEKTKKKKSIDDPMREARENHIRHIEDKLDDDPLEAPLSTKDKELHRAT